MTGRCIAIGDIHGCADALRAILQAISPESTDVIVTLGDVIDRGRADPADAIVDGVQRRQQEVTARLVEVTSAEHVQLPRLRGAQHRLDGSPLGVGWRCRAGLEIHGAVSLLPRREEREVCRCAPQSP